jgi:hypothetical protein
VTLQLLAAVIVDGHKYFGVLFDGVVHSAVQTVFIKGSDQQLGVAGTVAEDTGVDHSDDEGEEEQAT